MFCFYFPLVSPLQTIPLEAQWIKKLMGLTCLSDPIQIHSSMGWDIHSITFAYTFHSPKI